MGLGGIGKGFDMPDWIQDLTGGARPVSKDLATAGGVAPETPPAPAPGAAQTQVGRGGGAATAVARRGFMPSLEELRAKIAHHVGRADSSGKIGWLKREGGEPTRDVTSRFQALNGAAATGKSTLPPEAKDHVYLNVGGLFTEHYPGYFNANIERQKNLGLDARRVPVDTDAGVEQNAKVVRDSILEASKSGKQVVLIGHSKGGVDVTAALALYPELKPHVRAVVSMQTPYAGSPIASDVQSCPELRGLAERFIKLGFKGDPRALSDISYDSRRAFIEKHPYPADVPTVSLATSSSSQVSLTAAAASYVRSRYGAKSDGLVVAQDAEIPGSNVVRLDDMDHAAAAMQGPGGLGKYDPGDVTEALISLALTTPAAGAPAAGKLAR